MLRFEVVTIFPDFFRGPFEHGIIRRAQNAGLINIGVHDLRAFTSDRHKTVDDRPFGGGEGMVLKPEPIFACVESLGVSSREQRLQSLSSRAEAKPESRDLGFPKETVILLSPGGEMFNQAMAAELAQKERIVFICGRYEGVDERVAEHLADREVSVGDFVLSGGELGAAIIVDAVTRLVPGALGNEDSSKQESFTASTQRERADCETPSSTCGSGGLLDYPHYTRPAEFRGLPVPEVLANGNHEQIRSWRRRKALEKTLRFRSDLLKDMELSAADKKLVAELKQELGLG
ncbi:MAG TPA: tRNA (guanosine(37)-N1)-methyltransferase TrmD [Terriglobales bacterium]|nr:tRNA (guanosine(37)-N1)-methyltransferase TrmD [Terriglobales bacterium]